jgi:hypothetical protein
MSALKRSWARNTSGLAASARQRTEAARRRVDDAIKRLVQDPSKLINFNVVAAAANVTTAYLYKEPALRQRIGRLRQEQADNRQRLASVGDRTHESSRMLLLAKERRIRELELRLKQLEAELATCRGQLYDRL